MNYFTDFPWTLKAEGPYKFLRLAKFSLIQRETAERGSSQLHE